MILRSWLKSDTGIGILVPDLLYKPDFRLIGRHLRNLTFWAHLTMTPRSWLKSYTGIGILVPDLLYIPEIEVLLALKQIWRIFPPVFPAADPLTLVQNPPKTIQLIFRFFDIF